MSSEQRPVTRSIYLAVLREDVPSPLLPESDDEKGIENLPVANHRKRKPTRKPQIKKGSEQKTEASGQKPKYWTGHAKSSDGEVVRQTVTDRYIKMAKDTKFRADVAERIGLGFELPKVETVEVVPGVPSFQETGVSVSI
jgi:hypothetical protein